MICADEKNESVVLLFVGKLDEIQDRFRIMAWYQEIMKNTRFGCFNIDAEDVICSKLAPENQISGDFRLIEIIKFLLKLQISSLTIIKSREFQICLQTES